MRVHTELLLFAEAEELRAHFDARVAPTREARSDRFVWDYWHIPDQYTYFRTLAPNIIPPSLVATFCSRLREWGWANLGTEEVTLPWLSFYVDGCRQELHSDVTQGTWSYVYSLTRWDDNRRFTGGETLVGSSRLLNYWEGFEPSRSTESRHLVERIPALFDQLCVFDSRLPHGVATVVGTRDPLHSRLALHGWFRRPELSIRGSLKMDQVKPVIDATSTRVRQSRPASESLIGEATWRLTVEPDGRVADVSVVVHNLVALGSTGGDVERRLEREEKILRQLSFGAAPGPSVISFALANS